MATDHRWLSVVTGILAAVAAVLIVVHFVLDAGPDAEAPRWIIYLALAFAVFGAVFGGYGEVRRRRHRA